MQQHEILKENRKRAHRASDALSAMDYNGEEDEQTILIDFLANAMHLLSPEVVLDAANLAEYHYNAELGGN